MDCYEDYLMAMNRLDDLADCLEAAQAALSEHPGHEALLVRITTVLERVNDEFPAVFGLA